MRKMIGSKLLLLLLIAIATTNGHENSEICTVFKDLEIIPDVLDKAPQQFLKVAYSNNLMADKGNELTPTQVKDAPIVEWTADANSFYSLVMTGVDAPSRQDPFWREWLHWLVVNIPGTDMEEGYVLCPYIPAAVPKTAGLSRFVFLVYKQTEIQLFDEKPLNATSTAGHSNFDTRKFAEKYDLGDPIAGNIFQSRWDDYVPKILEQLHLEF